MIGRFRSILFVSVLQGSLAVAIIIIDGSEKCNRQLGFELQSSHVIENHNNRWLIDLWLGATCLVDTINTKYKYKEHLQIPLEIGWAMYMYCTSSAADYYVNRYKLFLKNLQCLYCWYY